MFGQETWSVKDPNKWIHRELSGKDAETLLKKKGRDGSFLVRGSRAKPDEYVITARRGAENDSYVHIRINNYGDCFDLFSGADTIQYASVIELLTELKVPSSSLMEKNGTCVNLFWPVLYETEQFTDKWFHGSLTRQEAEELLRKCGKPNCFLVRQSLSSPDDYVLSVLVNNGNCEHIKLVYSTEPPPGSYNIPTKSIRRPFSTIPDLIEYYKTGGFELESGYKCTLGEEVWVASECHFQPPKEKKKKNEKQAMTESYAEQFADLQKQETVNLTQPRSEGQRPENKTRNRYKNILPYDASRVVLKDGNPAQVGSDYINACYMSMCDGQKPYIAAQGCTTATVFDMWRMVWQENTSVIVMVTNVVEDGKNKCHQYWPKEKGGILTCDVYCGRIHVSFDSEASHADYKIRKFTLTRDDEQPEGSENYVPRSATRTVYQYHYTAWLDKSLPSKPESLVLFLFEVIKKQAETPNSGPVVVHCSAGIGRTGTFIAIGFIYNEIRTNGGTAVDIKSIVKKMRKQRCGMVQTEAQYGFLYSVIDFFVRKKDDQSLYANLPPVQAAGSIYQNT